jgi:hypothetical protein
MEERDEWGDVKFRMESLKRREGWVKRRKISIVLPEGRREMS